MRSNINDVYKGTFLNDFASNDVSIDLHIIPFRRYCFYKQKLKTATAAIMNVETEIDLVMHKRNGVLRILTQFGSIISLTAPEV